MADQTSRGTQRGNNSTSHLKGLMNRMAMASSRDNRLRRFRTVITLLMFTLAVLAGSDVLVMNGLELAFAPPASAFAQANDSQGKPNKANPKARATSSTRSPAKGSPPSPNTPVPPAQRLVHPLPPTAMKPGAIALSATIAAQFTGSDGMLEVQAPAGVVTADDLTAAGGKITLQITQTAPGGGSIAGGSGLISFGSYLVQVVDGKGLLAKHGLRKPITMKLHLGSKKQSAFDLTQSFVVLNGSLPEGASVAPTGNTGGPASQQMATSPALNDRTALGLGALDHANATYDSDANALVITPLIGNPSTSMSWNTHSPVAAFGNPDPFNVDLSGGGLTGSFPIELPPAPGGTFPPVAMSYSSASVSESHGPQASAGWVGEGWNLSLGAISWNEKNVTANCVSTCGNTWQSQWQLSDPFGTGSELIPDDFRISTYYDDTPYTYCVLSGSACTYPGWPKTGWRTADGSYVKIVSYVGPLTLPTMKPKPPCFRVWLTNGVMEEFGCTSDSLVFYYEPGNGDHVTSWLLDLITDPEGNQIRFTYQQDSAVKSGITYPRDTVLRYIEYDDPNCRDAQTRCATWNPLVRVVFNASHTPTWLTNSPTGCNTGTNNRCDNPQNLSGSGGLGAPDMQSTFVLNDVQVQTRSAPANPWNTLKTYQIGYEQTGPATITDPATGKQESAAGRLLLTRLKELGTDGATALPMRTFAYTQKVQYFTDSAYHPNPTTNCGPSWNTGNGSGCLLWSQSYEGNSYYLSTVDNGMGLQQTYTWENARNNTHGVNGGGGTNTPDPLYCNGLSATQQATYPCNMADDQSWSRVILTSQREQHHRAASTGNVLVDSLTNYGYSLTYPLNAQQCSDCVAGFYWGNQNDGDYLDYYNTRFMGFAQATVFDPDGSKEVHNYLSTDGFGVYDTTQVGCFAQYPPCRQAPWWSLNNAGHGQETQVDTYATDGTTVLRRATTQYSLACPPAGVSASPTFPAYPTAPGWGNWNGNRVSGLGHNNPVAVCAVRPKASDSYTLDGATDQFAAPHSTTSFAYDTLGRMTDQTTGVDTGLKAEYYDNSDLTNLKFTRLDANVDNTWGTGSPFPSIGVDSFSVRWTGYVQPQYSGTYTFYTNSDDGVRLWVNGTQLVNNWTNHAPTENSGTIALSAGQRYPITLEYYEYTSGALIQLSWSHTSQAKQIIPATAFFTRADGGGGTALGSAPATVTHTNYIQNDAITATLTGATGRYLIDFPAYVYTRDGGNTVHYTCSRTRYDGAAYAEGQQSSLTKGEATTSETFTGCGNAGNSFALTGAITTTTAYDVYGQPVATKDADANAGISGHVGCTVSSVQYTTCATYDSTYKTLEVGSGNALNQSTTTGYTSSAAGGFGFWPTSGTDANGQTTSSTYDALGRMTSTTLPGETTGLTTKSWTYTVWCNATGPQAPCVEIDEIQRIDDTTTVISRAFYDGYGRLVETRGPGPNGQDVVRYAWYDMSGETYFQSNTYFVSAYTGAPGVAAFSTPDATQLGTTTAFDALGRLTTSQDALSNTTTSTFATVCGAVSGDNACYEQSTVVDTLSHERAVLSDATGRRTYVQRFTGNSGGSYTLYATTKYKYDATGSLVRITHPDGATMTSFAFDAVGRQTGMTDPDRGSETYSYDQNGNLTQSVDARGAAGTIFTGYDGLNRAVWRNTTNSPSGAYGTWSYDSTASGNRGVGRLTSETFIGGPSNSLTGSYSHVYDARGQATSSTLTVNGTPYSDSKTYDDAGDIVTETYPTGEVLTLGYTSQGWIGGLSRTLSGSTTTMLSAVTYTGLGGASRQITGANLANDTYHYAATYDALLRATDMRITRVSDSAVLFAQTRTFDTANNVTAIDTTLPTGTDTQAFCYDEQDRLSWAGSSGTPPCTGSAITPGTLSSAQYTQSFSYDTLGRLTSGPLGSYTYGDAAHKHAATAISSGSGAWTATYDAGGNMTCRAPDGSTTCAGGSPTGAALSYDAEGMLSHWQDAPTSPSSTAEYLYDNDGNRVVQQSTSGATTTTTVYIGAIEEVATSGATTTTTTYYSAGGARVALAVNGVFSYLATDALSSASVALDDGGTGGLVTASRLYAPYGTPRYGNGSMPGSFGFTGQREDTETGLDYYVARYYDPTAGQFTSADSILPGDGYDPWGLSRYAYVAGNPVARNDPTGHCPFCVGFLVGAAVGGLISAGSQVVSSMQKGQSFGDAVKSVDIAEVGKAALIGGIIGGTGGAAGAALGTALAGSSAAVSITGSIVGGAAIGAGEGAGSQVLDNVMHGRNWSDDVGSAALFGAATGGLGGAAGAVGGRILRGICSFAAETAVATPDGSHAIGSLKVGDQVEAYDPQTGATSTQMVEHVWINQDHDLIDLTMHSDAPNQAAMVSDGAKQDAEGASYGLRVSPHAATVASTSATTVATDETIHTTAEHPWLTADHGWVAAGELHVGDWVIRLDGSIARITSVQAVQGVATMYNLQISYLHTFAVGEGQYVVHNRCNYGRLRQNNPSIGANDAPHHIIPCSCMKGGNPHPLLTHAGFDIDGPGNGIGLARDYATAATRGQPSHPLTWPNGYHRSYNALVNRWLDDAYNGLASSGSLTQANANAAAWGVVAKANRYIHLLGQFRPGMPLP